MKERKKIIETYLQALPPKGWIFAMLEQNPLGIVITDPEGNIFYANPKMLSMTGYSLEEILGKSTKILKSGHHDNHFYADLWDTISKGKTWEGEILNKRKDGSLYWEWQVIAPIHNEAGRIVYYLAMKQDITEQKRQDKEYAILAHYPLANPNPVMHLSTEGKILFANPASTPLLKEWKVEVGEFLPPFLRDNILSWNKKEKTKIVLTGTHGDKHYLYTLTFFPENQALFLYVEDITALVEAERVKRDFVAKVSHELRTPLTSLKGSLLLLEGVLNGKDPEILKWLEMAKRKTNDLQHLVLDLLDYQRLSQGIPSLKLTLLELSTFLHQWIDDFNANWGSEKVKSVIPSMEKKALILGDSFRIRQVLSNLVENAIRYSPPDAPVEIHLADEGHYYCIAVKDYGSGIPAELQPKIFQPFVQGQHGKGTGLGLSICKQIVEQHGGTITFESRMNEGTTFHIHLPKTTR